MSIPPPPSGTVPGAVSQADRPVATWRAIETIPVAVVGLVAAIVLGSAVQLLHAGSTRALAFSLIAELAQGGAVLGWVWLLHRRSIAAIGFPSRPAADLGFGMVGGLATFAIGAFGVAPLVSALLEAISGSPPRSPEQLPSGIHGGAVTLAVLAVVIAAPFGEELLFRGFLFRALRSRHGFWPSAAVSSAFFGLVHYTDGSWLLVPVMFVVGICLSWIYDRRGSILASMAAHATFNVIGLTLILTVR